jgi:septum formation protein
MYDFPEIYLASASPRRRELLKQISVPHRVLIVPAPDGEDEPRLSGESPYDYVVRTARDKASRAADWIHSQQLPILPVLAADTTVALGDLIFGKPESLEQARAMIDILSGKTHKVLTAVVLQSGPTLETLVSSTEVTFAPLSRQDVDRFYSTPEPWGKAGAYGIQGLASLFIERINGSYSGVMGLPIFETAQLLNCLSSGSTP